MNLDLKAAYERGIEHAKRHARITVDTLKELSALTMKNTGQVYKTAIGDFSSSNGDLRLLNVTAGFGGKSHMSYNKVPSRLEEFCEDLNKKRAMVRRNTAIEQYLLSFDAHYDLVTRLRAGFPESARTKVATG